MPGFPGSGVPETRRVGRQDLVDEQDISVLIGTEFKLGIGDDDPAG